MNGETEDNPLVFSRFRITKRKLSLILLTILSLAALIEFFVLGLARRTFVFYDIDRGIAIVEERMLKVSRGNPVSRGKPVSQGARARSPAREIDIIRYVEEALLGPVSPNSLPLFPKETRLSSLLYRDGVVYLNLSEEAVLPPLESLSWGSSSYKDAPLQGSFLQNGEVFTNMKTLYSGIKRNFPFVRDVRFFIAGKAAFSEKFR
jgi:hypothetical protein